MIATRSKISNGIFKTPLIDFWEENSQPETIIRVIIQEAFMLNFLQRDITLTEKVLY